MIEPQARKPEFAGALRRALENGELSLVYQPKVDLVSGTLAGVEALARWQTRRFGPVSPAVFIPMAEEAGFIDAVTLWGLKTAAAQWAAWRKCGLDTGIAFNISALSLYDTCFPDRIRTLCESQGMPSSCLTIELTEGARQDAVRLMDTLVRFRIMGMQVSLDDFGTGYSSLLLLRQLPFTEVKIDKRFVDDAVVSEDSRTIIESIVTLAHKLGLTVTAEGIDTMDTLTLMRDMGCDRGQGYFISEPLTGDGMEAFCRELPERGLFQSPA